jgi:hypothetical protein
MQSGRLLAVSIMISVLMSSAAANSGSLDQSSFSYSQLWTSPQTAFVGKANPELFPFVGPYFAQAQTFTVGTTGRLEAVGIHIQSTIPDVTEPLMLAIVPTLNGMPEGDRSLMLAVGEVGEDYYPVYGEGIAWGDTRRIDLSVFNLMLEAGKSYAIVLFSDAKLPIEGPFSHYSAPYGWDGVRTTEQYMGGRAFYAYHNEDSLTFSWTASAEDHDHYFQTFMSPVPEPEAYTLMAAGLMMLAAITRRARRLD